MDTETPTSAPPTAMIRSDTSTGTNHDGEEVRAAMSSTPAWWRRLGRDSAYTLTSLPLAVLAVVLVSVLVSVGAGLAVLLIGLPLLALGLLTARGFAHLERRRLNRLLGTELPYPTYLKADPSDQLLRRLTTAARDGQSWLDVVWTVVAVFTATISWSIAATWWATALGGTTYGIWEQTIPRGSDPVTLASLLGFGDSERADILVISAIGVFALLTLPLALRAAALLHSTLGRDLLCGRGELQEQVRRSEAGRAAGRVAEAESLRRLERDIHDGPQQRLVRLSMDLGRARAQLDRDPEQARATLEGALSQTRETVEELRSLSRGIAPPVLVDRGLEAALREAVARSVVPTTLSYEAPTNLPAHVESTVYFIVSECLTNVAKHSGAKSAHVSVVARDGEAVVLVEDDGHGGAMPTPEGGLAGLAQRTRAADGLLDITSPRGGPTVIRTELPCG
jgi:signal transduction histidine kinase